MPYTLACSMIKRFDLTLLHGMYWQVIDGIEVLDALEKVPVTGKKHRPEQDIRIEEIIIHANPLAT